MLTFRITQGDLDGNLNERLDDELYVYLIDITIWNNKVYLLDNFLDNHNNIKKGIYLWNV